MSDPRGWSVFWREEKRRFVLSYVPAPGAKPKQKVVTANLRPSQKRDAEKWAEAWLDESGLKPAQALARQRSGSRTWNDLFPLWMGIRGDARRDKLITAATHKDSISCVKRHVLPARIDRDVLGDTPAEEFDEARARKWLRDLRGKGAVNSTRNRFYAFVQFVNDAMAEGWVHFKVNPLLHESVTRELPAQPRHKTSKRTRIVPLDVAQSLMAHPRIPLQRRVKYAVAFACGARDGELHGLLWRDAQIDEGRGFELLIDKALSDKGPDGFATMGDTKTGVHRLIPLARFAALALREWRDGGWPELISRTPRPSDAIFVSGRGRRKGAATRPRSAAAFREDLVTVGFARVRAGESAQKVLAGYDFHHSTRASLISWLNRAGVRETVIQRIVGQGGEGVTQTNYIEEEWTDMVAALEVLPLKWVTDEQRSTHGGASDGSADGAPDEPIAGHKSLSADASGASPVLSVEPQISTSVDSQDAPDLGVASQLPAIQATSENVDPWFRKPQVSSSSLEGGSAEKQGREAHADVTTVTTVGRLTAPCTHTDQESAENALGQDADETPVAVRSAFGATAVRLEWQGGSVGVEVGPADAARDVASRLADAARSASVPIALDGAGVRIGSGGAS